ncbi:MAG TPA: hypothetical protein VK524_19275, partial [Polyangiaceae bacterium]|nr:hypothetical protein [Polyangiaceae bacterium]
MPNSLSLAFVEGLYADYIEDPASVPSDWKAYFDSLSASAPRPVQVGPSFRARSLFNPTPRRENAEAAPARPVNGNGTDVSEAAVRQDRVDQLVRAYRVRGHMIAAIDPLRLPRAHQPELDPEFYGFAGADLERKFSSRTIFGSQTLSLRAILQRLRNTYCRSIGVQFMHIDDLTVKNWLQDRMEGSENRTELKRDEQLRILKK